MMYDHIFLYYAYKCGLNYEARDLTVFMMGCYLVLEGSM